MAPDPLSGWTTAPPAARLAGYGDMFRFFESLDEVAAFLRRITQATAKKRRYRQRQRRGVIVVPVPVEPEIVEALLSAGRLDDERSFDREQVGLEFVAIVRQWAKEWVHR